MFQLRHHREAACHSQPSVITICHMGVGGGSNLTAVYSKTYHPNSCQTSRVRYFRASPVCWHVCFRQHTCFDPSSRWTFAAMSNHLAEVMLFTGKKPNGRLIMISHATDPCTSICVWLVCDLVVMCVQAVSDRALGDLWVCVRCRSVRSQKVWVCYNRVRHQCESC